MKYDFLILYEHKNREIDGLFLIKEELNKRGFSVGYEHIDKLVPKNSSVVITPYLYNDLDLYLIYKICGKNQKVISLRYEQVYSNEIENQINGFPYPAGEAKKVYHLCWGIEHRNKLISCGVREDKALVTGSVELDMLKWQGMYKSKRDIAKMYNLDLNKKWILFISSFSYTGLDKEEIEKYSKQAGSDISSFVDFSIKSKKVVLEWLTKILEYNNIEIIYRPHPSERQDNNIIDIQNNYKNFHIINNEVISQWIKVSDKVYNWYSTSAVQVAILDKGFNLLRPIKIPDSLEIRYMKEFNHILTFADFKNDIFREDSLKNKPSSIFDYYDLNTIAYKQIADNAVSILLSSNKCEIDYDKIIKKIKYKTKIKYVLRPVVYPIFDFLSRFQIFTRIGRINNRLTVNRDVITNEEAVNAKVKAQKFIEYLKHQGK